MVTGCTAQNRKKRKGLINLAKNSSPNSQILNTNGKEVAYLSSPNFFKIKDHFSQMQNPLYIRFISGDQGGLVHSFSEEDQTMEIIRRSGGEIMKEKYYFDSIEEVSTESRIYCYSFQKGYNSLNKALKEAGK